MFGNQPAIMLPVYTDPSDPANSLGKDNKPADGSGKTTESQFYFTMQNGQVHVYIVLDDIENAPEVPQYTAALTVEGPVGEPQGAAGAAT